MPENVFKLNWQGKKVSGQMANAAKAAGVWWGETVVSLAKQRVHRLTGTLSRSLNFRGPQESGSEFIVEAGSIDWFTKLPYGLYEYKRGGSHDYLTGPVEEANRGLPDALRRAVERNA